MEPGHPTVPESIDPRHDGEQPRVAVTLHIAKDALELLRDVALAGQLTNVAERSHDGLRDGFHDGLIDDRPRPTSVEAVVAMLIESNRPWLESLAEFVRGPGKT
jgi:hypothetical protein